MRVSVDGENCVTTGQCARALPAVFRLREEDGIGVVVDPAPPADLHETVREVARRCPAEAIVVEG
jgi:ferredoxin